MYVVRPIRLDDLDALLEMAQVSSGGITTLPSDRALLQESIERSLFAFSIVPRGPKGERYLFVLENRETGRAVGCSGIFSKTGGYHPLYFYRPEEIEKSSASADLSVRHHVLMVDKIYDGPSELGTLFLLQSERRKGVGRLTSLSRLLFIALHRNRFEENLMASLRGWIDNEGRSPFWEHVGLPFFGTTLAKAYALRSTDPRFVRDLCPDFPIYLNLLPVEVRERIGQTHPDTTAALHILRAEGFRCTHHFDLFDAGPKLESDIKELSVVKAMREAPIRCVNTIEGARTWMVCNARLDFRACLGAIQLDANGEVTIDKETAEALNVAVSDTCAFVPVTGKTV